MTIYPDASFPAKLVSPLYKLDPLSKPARGDRATTVPISFSDSWVTR